MVSRAPFATLVEDSQNTVILQTPMSSPYAEEAYERQVKDQWNYFRVRQNQNRLCCKWGSQDYRSFHGDGPSSWNDLTFSNRRAACVMQLTESATALCVERASSCQPSIRMKVYSIVGVGLSIEEAHHSKTYTYLAVSGSMQATHTPQPATEKPKRTAALLSL